MLSQREVELRKIAEGLSSEDLGALKKHIDEQFVGRQSVPQIEDIDKADTPEKRELIRQHIQKVLKGNR